MKNLLLLQFALMGCHFIGDFTHASRPWMLSAKRFGTPTLPIFAHAIVHAVLMGVVCWLMLSWKAGLVALIIQLSTHFAIDVSKGRMNRSFDKFQDPARYPHWYLFGADQMAHNVVILAISYIVLTIPQ